ncbi:MAG: nodulation protein E [gamma proteobacterium endosymbiont of Lamellibrachia anaximandri]|nr:nodulation protein E [gamma proteobacterium endosymbiont of Lamellibrachia anaximandri]MBL3534240.1 nodulation protein E [gamma proteobacterium endosymbiont of Lamellibrachia anaximandri]MBL3599822.1 nodulation protein E [gamma proteobacterium endosymbiont of Lamellibrachia anaximandri]
MSLPDQTEITKAEETAVSAREFINYCEAERDRRRNSGDEFDEESFAVAMERVLRKLKVLEDEGWS